ELPAIQKCMRADGRKPLGCGKHHIHRVTLPRACHGLTYNCWLCVYKRECRDACGSDRLHQGSLPHPWGVIRRERTLGPLPPKCLWGEERIANELRLKLGSESSPRTVRKYLPPGEEGGLGANYTGRGFCVFMPKVSSPVTSLSQ